jgi:hypothetical protein
VNEQELREAVRQILLRNIRHGHSALLDEDYCYIAPALKPYPFQWFWDTCFHVVMLARLDECEWAKKNLRSLFAMQEDNGFVGHMIFWRQVLPLRRSDVLQARPTWRAIRPHMSALIQPSLVGTALLACYEESGDRAFLKEMFPRLRRYHDWLAQNRDFDGDGLLTIISPFESGIDWKPSYDEVLGYRRRVTRRLLLTSSLYWRAVANDAWNFVLRYDLPRIRRRGGFLVKDAGFNAIYAFDLHAMERLAALADEDGTVFAERRRRVAASILKLMYDEGAAAFLDLRQPQGSRIPVRTATIFFPLAIDEVDQEVAERVLSAHFDREDGFATPLPLPSVEVADRAFCPYESWFLWRGPAWACINWFLYHALKRRGFDERAERLRRSLWTAIEKSGFREYYNPFSGEGYGAHDFTWSGLLLDMR